MAGLENQVEVDPVVDAGVVWGWPTCVPAPDAHTSAPLAPVTCVGSQMKNVTVPVGVPPAVVPVTTAWSNACVLPIVSGLLSAPALAELPLHGVVTVVVGSWTTVKHSADELLSVNGAV
jgi:hypothetical protein